MVRARRRNERGVALLAVLLGVALMTLLVVDFAMTSGVGFVSAANQANELRAGYLARSGISVGLGLLAESARAQTQEKTPVDSLNDAWATPFPLMAVGGGSVQLAIVDEARKLSINAMVNQNPGATIGQNALGSPNQNAIAKVQRLFMILGVNPDLVQGIISWITPIGAGAAGNSGDYYLGLVPPYQPRYGPMPTIADLRMVQGFNDAVFSQVSPFLTVMNEKGVNVNTAPPQVLAALEPQWMEDQQIVQEIVEARAIRPFTQPTDLKNILGTAAPPTLERDVTMQSTYFTITGMGTYAGARRIVSATFQRQVQQNTGTGMLAAWHEQ